MAGTRLRRGRLVNTPVATSERLPVILLTGFLGAGKTTLLLRWLSDAPATGRRLGVVMNEFGADSVDSQLINRPGLALEQVSGGCVCCAPDNELGNAVTRMVKEGNCDDLVLETSGLADPDSVIDVLTDTDLLTQVRLQAVVTVLDARWHGDPAMDPAERILARRQIQFAHVVCLSKCDLIDETRILAVEAAVREINPSARLIRLPHNLPDLASLLNGVPAEAVFDPELKDTAGSTATQHLHTRYHSLSWRVPVPLDRSRFEAYLSGLNPREVVRAKGFVRFSRQPDRLFVFQSVFGHAFIEEFPARPHPDPVIVLIGPGLNVEEQRDRLRALAFGSAMRNLAIR